MIRSPSTTNKQSPVKSPAPPIPHFAVPALASPPTSFEALPSEGIRTTVVTHGDIAQRAHDIYVKGGFQQGQSDQHWHQAEHDLRAHGIVACHAEHQLQGVFAPDSIRG